MSSLETSNCVSKDFYELCYRQYEFEMKETDQIYQRVSFILIFLSLLGTIIFRLGRIDIFDKLFLRDVFLYYLSIIVAISSLATSITFGILCGLPRKGKYKHLDTMNKWQKFREEWSDTLKQSGEQDENIPKKVNDILLHEITIKLAEAQANNAPINERRRQYFYKCFFIAALSIIPVSIEAFFYLLLKMQGI